VARETARFADNARSNGALTQEDDAWIARIVEAALAHAPTDRANAYVHGDYKLGNLCVVEEDGAWRVSGLFDLHESRFGDGASDLCRQLCSYLDTDVELAGVFLDAYRARADLGPAIEARFALYLVNDRMKFWDYFTRPPKRASWLEGHTFRSWVGRYLNESLRLVANPAVSSF
jgi:aminoglycoside phosphotransferase (APT) family kinase protein